MGKPLTSASLATAVAKSRRIERTTDDDPPTSLRDVPRQRLAAPRSGSLRSPLNACVWASCAAGSADLRHERPERDQRLAERQVQVDRPGWCARRHGHGATDAATDVRLADLADPGDRQLRVPLGEAAVEMHLVDGLRSAPVAQLRLVGPR